MNEKLWDEAYEELVDEYMENRGLDYDSACEAISHGEIQICYHRMLRELKVLREMMK